MTVRAKFRVDSINHRADGSAITLFPVTNGSIENEQFFKWTPGGKIELSTINPDAAKQFIPGAEYYIDFTPAA